MWRPVSGWRARRCTCGEPSTRPVAWEVSAMARIGSHRLASARIGPGGAASAASAGRSGVGSDAGGAPELGATPARCRAWQAGPAGGGRCRSRPVSESAGVGVGRCRSQPVSESAGVRVGRCQSRPVSESAAYRALARLNLIDSTGRRPRDRNGKRWERGEPTEWWQMDVVGGSRWPTAPAPRR
jgi:hypothetical protein